MDKAKIRLSPKEKELVLNADWILTKNGILQKVKHMLEELQERQQYWKQTYGASYPAEVIKISPKISRGENYKGLPYLILDYPRYFEKNNHWAIRSMFWWGNFFSITLHLSGHYKDMHLPALEKNIPALKDDRLFICINEDEWEHHFETSNYLPLYEMEDQLIKMHFANMRFIKLAKMFPLEEWDNAGELLFASFTKMMDWLED
jgi:hypothetical protein